MLIKKAALPITLLLGLTGTVHAELSKDEPHYELKLLGKYIFFDNISRPAGVQGCVTCHTAGTGGTHGDSKVNLRQVAAPGAAHGAVGNIKPPTNTYSSFIQPFETGTGLGNPASGGARGGHFWNGRSEGRSADVGGALFPAGATKHLGEEVFQGNRNPKLLEYAAYFGPISDQALNPMPNPLEQNIDRQSVCNHVKKADYAPLYEQVWGEYLDCSSNKVKVHASDVDYETEFDISFKRLMLAVGAWQSSSDLNSFSSKRDIALKQELACIDRNKYKEYYKANVCKKENPSNWGKFPLVGLTKQENIGHDIFYNSFTNPDPSLPVANCGFCHSDNPPNPADPSAPVDDGSELLQLYADDTYHNIGTPANPKLPADPRPGLSGHTGDGFSGKGLFKTPTLRNVNKRPNRRFVKAYTHNGWFKSLESIVHFYNTSDINGETAKKFGITRCRDRIKTEKRAKKANCWPTPEWQETAPARLPNGVSLIGDLGMTKAQEESLVAYMKTLTDKKTVQPPPPYKSGGGSNTNQLSNHIQHNTSKQFIQVINGNYPVLKGFSADSSQKWERVPYLGNQYHFQIRQVGTNQCLSSKTSSWWNTVESVETRACSNYDTRQVWYESIATQGWNYLIGSYTAKCLGGNKAGKGLTATSCIGTWSELWKTYK